MRKSMTLFWMCVAWSRATYSSVTRCSAMSFCLSSGLSGVFPRGMTFGTEAPSGLHATFQREVVPVVFKLVDVGKLGVEPVLVNGLALLVDLDPDGRVVGFVAL